MERKTMGNMVSFSSRHMGPTAVQPIGHHGSGTEGNKKVESVAHKAPKDFYWHLRNFEFFIIVCAELPCKHNEGHPNFLRIAHSKPGLEEALNYSFHQFSILGSFCIVWAGLTVLFSLPNIMISSTT